MVSTCCIRNCRNRSHDQRGKRVNEVQFFSFPVWKQSSGSRIAALTKSRRTAWVEAVKQSNITFDNISRHKFVCSRHFHSGKPAYEMLQSHRDWVPSLHLGHTKGKASLTVNNTEPAAPPDLAVPKSHVEEAATKENTGERQAVSNGHVYKDFSVTGGEIVSPCTAVALISVLEHVTTNQTGCIGTRGKATCATESPDNTETRCSSQAHIKETLERRVSQHVNYSSLSKASPTLLCPGTSKPVTPELFCDPDSTTCVSFKTTHTSPVKVKLEPQHNAFGEPSTEATQGDAGEEMEVCDVSGEQDAVVGSQDRLTDAVSAVSTDRAGRARSTGSVDVDEVMELADVEQTRPEAPTKVDDKRMPIEEQSSDLMPAVVNIVVLRKDTRSLAVMEGEHISNGAPGFKDEVEPEQLSSSSARRAVPTDEIERRNAHVPPENVQIMVGDAIKQETFEMEDETTTRPFSQSSTGSKVSRRPASSVPLVKVKDEPVDEEYHSAQIPDPSEEEEPNNPAFNLKISAVYSLRKVSTQSETPGDVVPLPQAAEVTTSPPAPAAPTRASCSTCRKVLLSGQTAFQKKGSKELYCCNACLSSHIQPIIKLKTQCHYCRKVIESLSEVIVVPVDRTGAMKNFCSNMCIFNCTRDSAPPIPSSAATVAKGPPSQCSHCAKSCTSKHDVNMKGSVHKLCSDQCFIGFHADHTCCNCSQYCYAKVLTMRLENVTKTFCKAECVSVYRQRFKTPSSCAMCGAARPVCDMVEVTGADDKVDLFCTGSCGEAYKLQTGSASECAHCHKVSAPAYHLARSNGSPWSFCTLSCVIAFQGNMGKTKHRATVAVPTPNRTTIASPTSITVPPPTRTTVPPPTVTIVPPPIRTNVSFPTPITVPPPTRANVSPPVLPATTSPSTTSPAVDDVKLSCSQCCKFISSRPEPVQHKSDADEKLAGALSSLTGCSCVGKVPRRISPQNDAINHAVSQTDKTSKLEVKYINPYKGRGLFSLAPFLKDEFVAEYRGEIIDFAEAERRRNIYHNVSRAFMSDFLWKGRKWCVDAAKENGSLGRLVNDEHTTPNCKITLVEAEGKPHLCLFAMRDIDQGEEMTYDYGGTDQPWRQETLRVMPAEANEDSLSSERGSETPDDYEPNTDPPDDEENLENMPGLSDLGAPTSPEGSDTPAGALCFLNSTGSSQMFEEVLEIVVGDVPTSAPSSNTPNDEEILQKSTPIVKNSDRSVNSSDDSEEEDGRTPRLRGTKRLTMKVTVPEDSDDLLCSTSDSGEEFVPRSSDRCNSGCSDTSHVLRRSRRPHRVTEPSPRRPLPDSTSCLLMDFDANSENTQISTRSPTIDAQGGESFDTDNMEVDAEASVTVNAVTRKGDGSRLNNKKHYCPFCFKPFSKMARHLEQVHSREKDVVTACRFPKHSKQRRIYLDQLRNEGNYAHNAAVLKTGRGELVPQKQPSQESRAKDYMHCIYCKGLFLRSLLWRHVKNCKLRTGPATQKPGKNRVQSLCASAEPAPSHISTRLWQLIGSMNQDDTTRAIKGDRSIVQFGEHMLRKSGPIVKKPDQIRQKMRELGRFLINAKKVSTIKEVETLIDSKYYMTTVNAVKLTSGFNSEAETFQSKSLALKLGYSLVTIAKLLESNGRIAGNRDVVEKALSFQKVHATRWNELISAAAPRLVVPLATPSRKFTTKGGSRKRWETTEVQAVERSMRLFITSLRVPGKKDCEKCLQDERSALKDRDWQSVKFYVHNRIMAARRKKRDS